MISPSEFSKIVGELRLRGFADDDIAWSENIGPPANADEFALEIIFVICNSGMQNKVARKIFERVSAALAVGNRVSEVFGHKGKVAAIEALWRDRDTAFAAYMAAPDKIAHLGGLPWIGNITKYHCAKNFGVDCAKPDVHLQRLADLHATTPQDLCAALAAETGLKVATVDLLLWRACAEGVVNSRTGQMA